MKTGPGAVPTAGSGSRRASGPDRLPRILSLAAHEIRTPLAVAAGYLRMLLREPIGTLSEAKRTMLEGAAMSCARIGALVDEMSELQQLEAGEVAVPTGSFDLSSLVIEQSGTVREGDDRGIRLEARAARPVVVTGDRTRLGTALGALMRAALREREGPDVVVVECSSPQDTTATWATVTIGDETNGRLPAAVAGTVSPPFDEWRGGLGLALPVARRVIEAHGGALW